MASTTTFRDNIYQEIKLYIEGVQVPFINININQSYGSLPFASIAVPPQIGLMDIARFYQPKVHVFFTERFSNTEKVLFTGIITASHYAKTKDGNGSMSIVFDCTHRYHLITECLLDYTGFVREGDPTGSPQQTYQIASNSKAAMLNALTGWTEVSTGDSMDFSKANPGGPKTPDGVVRTDVLPSKLSSFSNRLKGMVGVFINFWNQLKRQSYNPELSSFQNSFVYLYEPLIEDGLQFFKRLTGHMLVEQAIDNSRQPGCGEHRNKNVLIPPCNKLFFSSAVQANLAVETLSSYLQNSNELTNLYSVFQTYYQTLEYDVITLASPAEVLKDPASRDNPSASTYAVDTIVKPNLPFYFSPTCNILYPSMYTSVSVSYDEISMPTRLDILNYETAIPVHYRTPASVRESIAIKKQGNLSSTLGTSNGAIGKYEMGRGVKYESFAMPNWLSNLGATQSTQSNSNSTDTPAEGTDASNALKDLKEGWNARYPGQANLNPWDSSSGIQPYQQLVFSTSDYYFTKKFAGTKAGNVNCLFNPYIIPGYPMDILEASPNLPSFHAMCASVSHNIGSNNISTQVTFVAATTYTELVNYYIPFINPYLQVTLGLAKNPTLVNTDSTGDALNKAHDFYFPTLGVKAAAPENIFDFSTGMTKSVKMSEGNLIDSGKPLEDHSSEDDLLLCQRPIESKADYADRIGIKFIDLVPQNYSPTGVKYVDPNLTSNDTKKYEIGQSQFLDYNEDKFAEINKNTR